MKILISGGTGFVGRCLANCLLQRGDQVRLLSSKGGNADISSPNLSSKQCDTTQVGEWQKEIGNYDVIINLAGRTIFNLWSDAYKKEIYASRVATTKNIIDGLPQKSNAILISCSAAGFYGDGGEDEKDESSPSGSDFLANVCKDWETEAMKAEQKGARVAIIRLGVVLGRQGGAMATMKTPFKLGMGGPIGSGKQWFPWIHIDDLISAIVFLMDSSDISGVFNCTAPGRVRQKEFAKELGGALKRPAFLPTPAFIMKTMLGEFGASLLMGQRAVPRALLERGFIFRYPNLKDAFGEILND